MPTSPLQWDLNLRANLVLWREPTENIRALAGQDGSPYDEAALLKVFPSKKGKAPNTTRTVRNTFEVMAKAGLALKRGAPSMFELTALGRCLFSFLGTIGPKCYANDDNRALLAELVVPALGVISERRAVWSLLLKCGGSLTSEELNRSIPNLDCVEDAASAAVLVLKSRAAKDVTLIGPRAYHDGLYATDPGEQRKAMHPQFLLASGGGLLMDFESTGAMRRSLPSWAIPLIEAELRRPTPMLTHAGTDADIIEMMSAAARPPLRVRR